MSKDRTPIFIWSSEFSKEFRHFKLTGKCPKCKEFQWTIKFVKVDGTPAPLKFRLERDTYCECRKCQYKFPIYNASASDLQAVTEVPNVTVHLLPERKKLQVANEVINVPSNWFLKLTGKLSAGVANLDGRYSEEYQRFLSSGYKCPRCKETLMHWYGVPNVIYLSANGQNMLQCPKCNHKWAWASIQTSNKKNTNFQYLLALVILISGFSLAHRVYNAGLYCYYAGSCYSEYRFASRLIVTVSLLFAGALLKD